MMVVKLPTAMSDSNFYFMQQQLPPMPTKKNCIGHFQNTVPVGIVHHLTTHTDAMKGNWDQIYASLNPIGVNLYF